MGWIFFSLMEKTVFSGTGLIGAVILYSKPMRSSKEILALPFLVLKIHRRRVRAGKHFSQSNSIQSNSDWQKIASFQFFLGIRTKHCNQVKIRCNWSIKSIFFSFSKKGKENYEASRYCAPFAIHQPSRMNFVIIMLTLDFFRSLSSRLLWHMEPWWISFCIARSSLPLSKKERERDRSPSHLFLKKRGRA